MDLFFTILAIILVIVLVIVMLGFFLALGILGWIVKGVKELFGVNSKS